MFHRPSRQPSRTLASHGSRLPGGNRVYLPIYVQRWKSWVTSRRIEKGKTEREREKERGRTCTYLYVQRTLSSLGDARGRELRDKIVKGEFYSHWGSELLLSLLSVLLFPSLSLYLSLCFDHSTVCGLRFAASPPWTFDSLRRHQTLYVVTAVIATDYVLLRDLLLQRLHTFRGQVVANLHTHTENATM